MNGARPRTGGAAFVVVCAIALATGVATTAGATGEPGPGASASASASAPASTAGTSALPDLPRLPPIALPEPDPAALQELDRLLSMLTADDERTRTNAKNAIADVTAAIVPAIRHRIQDVRASVDREAAPLVLDTARKAGRKAMKARGDGKGPKEKKHAKGKGDKPSKDDDETDGDWLDFLLVSPRAKGKDWQDVVRIVAMERMLVAVGTTPAMREMIQFLAYFGDLVRIDLQRQVAKLRDKVVPALIEARQHDATVVQKWANKQLDALGRAIPGEAVASNDTQILADVLRAYGRTRDVDAVRVVLSFCNSDRAQLREASRESIAAIGDPGIWQLRDQYLNLTGNKVPHGWTWDRIARELFALYDRARLVEVYKLMDEGSAAMSAGKIEDAVSAFDKVLARAPLFERRTEMVKAYFERARAIEDAHRDDALAMLRKAIRIDPKGPDATRIEAEIAYLEGTIAMEGGAPDKAALLRAIELDPPNERAKKALASLEEKVIAAESPTRRYVAAGGVGLGALIAMALLARRRRTPTAAHVAPTEQAVEPPIEEAQQRSEPPPP